MSIWSLSDCNWTRTHSHLVHKRTLNSLAKLAKWLSCVVSTYLHDVFDCMFLSCHTRVSNWIYTLWLSVRLWTKWLWVGVQMQSKVNICKILKFTSSNYYLMDLSFYLLHLIKQTFQLKSFSRSNHITCSPLNYSKNCIIFLRNEGLTIPHLSR